MIYPYAGIGARDAPEKVLGQMSLFASRAARAGWFLRSGGARRGADYHFEYGARHSHLERPEVGYDARPMGVGSLHGDIIRPEETWRNMHWLTEARKHHPAWDKCDNFAKSAHGRNCAVILGRDLRTPVNFVMCWTKNGQPVGGTGHGIRVAQAYNIPVYNLAVLDFEQLMKGFGFL